VNLSALWGNMHHFFVWFSSEWSTENEFLTLPLGIPYKILLILWKKKCYIHVFLEDSHYFVINAVSYAFLEAFPQMQSVYFPGQSQYECSVYIFLNTPWLGNWWLCFSQHIFSANAVSTFGIISGIYILLRNATGKPVCFSHGTTTINLLSMYF
jgi:hypothetical protein